MKFKLWYSAILLLILYSSALSDIWVPPWGEVVSNDNVVVILVGDTTATLDVTSTIRMRKLISDDYLLDFERNSEIGMLEGETIEIEGSGSFLDQVAGDHALTFTHLSQTLLEDTLEVEVHTTYTYSLDEDQHLPSQLYFYQTFFRSADGPPWEGIIEIMPMFDQASYSTRIISNMELSVHSLEYDDRYRESWGQAKNGTDMTLEGEMIWVYEQGEYWEVAVNKLGHWIELVDREGYTDSVTDEMTYELTPERRIVVPDIILEEDVRINIAAWDEGHLPENYRYHLLAEIRLDPELAQALSPMWLWFPNDQTSGAEVNLVGLFARGAWGEYPERWQEEPLEINEVNLEGQAGFFIHVPQLYNPIVNPNDEWFWSDPRLRIEISSEIQQHSARFILITAPLEYSQIRFLLPYWAEPFNCESPFDEMRIQPNSGVIFSGICNEPGIAQVQWAYQGEVTPGINIPGSFGISSISPNPFNADTRISYGVDKPGRLEITIFDQNGGTVHKQTEYVESAGNYYRQLDGTSLPTGVYVVRLGLDEKTDVAKMVLIR